MEVSAVSPKKDFAAAFTPPKPDDEPAAHVPDAGEVSDLEAAALREQAQRKMASSPEKKGGIKTPRYQKTKVRGARGETGVGTRGKPRVRKSDGKPMRVTTVHLPVETFKKVGKFCAETEMGFSEAVLEGLTVLMEQRKAG
jgi:hypothetical protein